MKPKHASVDDAFAAAPAAALPLLRGLRALALKAAPGAEERISYGMPAVFVDGRVLVYFAAFKDHVGVFPPPRGDAAFMKRIAPYAGPKGNLSFPHGAKIPAALLRAVIDARFAAVRDPDTTAVKAKPKSAPRRPEQKNDAKTEIEARSARKKTHGTGDGKTAARGAAKAVTEKKKTAAPRRAPHGEEGAPGSFARRARRAVPAFVMRALKDANLAGAYRERPPYQRNDYIGWITGAKTPATQKKRLARMLDELGRGGVYMNMKHAASAKPKA